MGAEVETYRAQRMLEEKRKEIDKKLEPALLQDMVDIIITEGLAELHRIIKDTKEDGDKIKAYNATVSTGRYLEQRKMNDEMKQRKLELNFNNVVDYDNEEDDGEGKD